MKRKLFYLKEFKKTLPILLRSQCLKGNNSGCFHEGFLKGVEPINSRWQEAVLSLNYFKKLGVTNLLPRIESGIKFWCSLQNHNGSFPELKYKESYGGTAFSTFAMVRTLNNLTEELSTDIEDSLIETLKKSCKYLKMHNQQFFTNQEAMAGLALIECSEFIKKYKKHGFNKIKFIIKNQTKDGFYTECSGPDIGYGSLTMEILGHIWLRHRKKYITKSVENFLEWIKYFIFPDGSVGGCYNTRKPGWLTLDGFEIFKNEFPICETILKKHISGHNEGIFDCTHLVNKRHVMTDGFRLFFAYDNYSNLGKNTRLQKLPCQRRMWVKDFKTSNIRIIKKPKFMAVLSFSDASKNGLTLWTKDWMMIDLNNVSPNLTEIKKNVNNSYLEISGRPLIYKKILNKIHFSNLWNIIKYLLPKHNISYQLFDDNISIFSSKTISIPFLGFRCGKKTQLNTPNSIFYKRDDYYVKKVKGEISIPIFSYNNKR